MKKITLYIVRFSRIGTIASSGPCSNCISIIRSLGIKKIVYSNMDGTFTFCNTSDYNVTHVTFGFRYIDNDDYKTYKRKKKKDKNKYKHKHEHE